MKIATWNVNSIAARLPRIVEFLGVHRPEVLCIQETRVDTDAFPTAPLAEAGYAVVDYSTGGRSGVAILHRQNLDAVDVVRGLEGSPLPDEGRWIEATIGGVKVVSVYVINGRTLEDPMYEAKLRFLDAMAARVRALADAPAIVGGDFNIAPADADVYDPVGFVGSTHVSEPERRRLEAILENGMVDVFRAVHAEKVEYTWWDYRAGNFHRGLGLRIDLLLASRSLAPRLRACGIDRTFRKGKKPSDHAPLLMELEPIARES